MTTESPTPPLSLSPPQSPPQPPQPTTSTEDDDRLADKLVRWAENNGTIPGKNVEALMFRVGMSPRYCLGPLVMLIVLHAVIRGHVIITYFTTWVPAVIPCVGRENVERVAENPAYYLPTPWLNRECFSYAQDFDNIRCPGGLKCLSTNSCAIVFPRKELSDTTVTEFNTICERHYLTLLPGMLTFTGALVGSVFRTVSDFLGRRIMIFSGLFVDVLMFIAQVFSIGPMSYSLFRGMCGVFSVVTMGAVLPMMYELVPAKRRTVVSIMQQVGWATMDSILSGLNQAIGSWRIFLAVFACFAALCLFIRICLPPSVPWMLGTLRANGNNDRWDNAEASLEVLSDALATRKEFKGKSKKELRIFVYEELTKQQQEVVRPSVFAAEEETTAKKKCCSCSLLPTPPASDARLVARLILILGYLNAASTVYYFCLNFLAGKFKVFDTSPDIGIDRDYESVEKYLEKAADVNFNKYRNVNLNQFLFSIFEFPGILIFWITAKKMKRRRLGSLMFLMSSLPMLVLATCHTILGAALPDMVLLLLSLLGKFFIVPTTMCYIGLVPTEVFPTKNRATFMSAVIGIGRLAQIPAMYSPDLYQYYPYAVELILGLLTLLGSLLVFCLPETKDKSLPQNLDDVRLLYRKSIAKNENTRIADSTYESPFIVSL